VPIEVLREVELLGTAGGVANARACLGTGDVVVYNGDIVAEVDVEVLVAALRQSEAHAVLAYVRRPRGEGAVGVDAEGRVVRLRSSSRGDETFGGEYMGIAALSARCVATLPERGCLVGDAWIPTLLGEGPDATRILAMPYRGPFRDVGSLRAYLDANLDAVDDHGRSIVGRGATIAGTAAMERCVIGDGARVVGAGLLRRVVVWPGATATAPLEDAIVTLRGVVRVEASG
jgi:mannose-1-phosphate guanylyltransferase